MERIEIICPNCRAAYVIAHQFAGRYAKCKKCGQSFLAAEADYSESRLEDLQALENSSESISTDELGQIPEPIGFGTPPPLPPAPKLPMVEATSFIYPPRVRAKQSINFDWIAPTLHLLLLGFLVLIGLHLTVGRIPFFNSPVRPIDNKGYVWLTLLLFAFCYFAVIGPAVWGGVMLAAKIGHEDPGFSSYLRASSIAAIPFLMLFGILVIRWAYSWEAVIVGLVIVLPLAFVALKLIFDFEIAWTFLALVFASIFFLPAAFVSGGVVKWSMSVIRGEATPAAVVGTGPQRTHVAQSPMIVNRPPAESPVVSLRRRIENFNSEDFSQRSRESLEGRLASFRRDMDSLKRTTAGDAEWPTVDAMLNEVEARLATAVSAKPPESLFTPMSPTHDWSTERETGAVESPVSFKAYHVRPPAEAKLDLTSSEDDAQGLVWRNSAGSVAFRTVPIGNPRQKQPWVMSHGFMSDSATQQKLFAIMGPGAEIDAGTINGIEFVRVRSSQNRVRRTQYISREPDLWLVIEIIAREGGPSSVDLLEASAGAIQRAAGERIDPFSIDRVAPRLADDPQNASILLIRHGKLAEDAVLKQLQTGDPHTRRAAAEVLKSIGTQKSLDALAEAARSQDSFLADVAKQAMQKIAPGEIDPVAVALIDLEAASPFKRGDAYKVLLSAEPDARREKVAATLERLLLDDRAFGSEYDDLGAALAKWARKETVGNLLPVLDQEHGFASKRRAVMKTLAKIGDPKAIYPIARWLILDSQSASAALIEIGPACEVEVLKLLREKNAVARREAARVLERVGGSKSIPELLRASNDPRDKPAADAAKQALDAVRQRVKSAKDTTTAPAR